MPTNIATELLLSHPQGWGLTTITPLQRAICRAIDGEPIPDEIWEYEDPRYRELGPTRIADCFSGVRPTERPSTVILLAGVRAGKSKLVAAVASRAALCGADISRLSPGEMARVSILATAVDVARSTFGQIEGGVRSSPILRRHLEGEALKDSLYLRHASGSPVEIKVVPGHKAGSSLVSRWSAGVIIDEAPRQASAENGYTVTIEDQLSALSARLLPGAQVFLPGSPIGPTGYIYTQFTENFGNPSRDLLVVRAPAYLLNPVHWTLEFCTQLKDRDPDDYRTECLGEFRGADGALVPVESITAAQRAEGAEILPPQGRHRYMAAIDPATRGNAWTLTLGHMTEGGFVHVDLVRQWQGTKNRPLNPADVFEEIRPIVDRYGVQYVVSDQHAFDAIQVIAKAKGVRLVEKTITGSNKTEVYEDLRLKFVGEEISIPQDADLRNDLLMVRKRLTPRGDVSIVMAQSSSGRHCDYAACLALLVHSLTRRAVPAFYDPRFDRYIPSLRI